MCRTTDLNYYLTDKVLIYKILSKYIFLFNIYKNDVS